MDKITNYMRVTKKRKAALDEGVAKRKPLGDSGGSALSKKQPVHEQEADAGDGEYVPEFIYKVVKYVRKGEPGRRVPPTLQKVAAYIETHYIVPRDFESDHMFGPYSGLTYEKRLARAYSQHLLQPTTAGRVKTGVKTGVKSAQKPPEPICVACADLGHSYKECPDGF